MSIEDMNINRKQKQVFFVKIYSIELAWIDKTNALKSDSDLNLHLENEGHLKTTLYNQKDDIGFTNVNIYFYDATLQHHLHMNTTENGIGECFKVKPLCQRAEKSAICPQHSDKTRTRSLA